MGCLQGGRTHRLTLEVAHPVETEDVDGDGDEDDGIAKC
jgi:hypothetical protein